MTDPADRIALTLLVTLGLCGVGRYVQAERELRARPGFCEAPLPRILSSVEPWEAHAYLGKGEPAVWCGESIMPVFTSWGFTRGLVVDGAKEISLVTVESPNDVERERFTWPYELDFNLEDVQAIGTQTLLLLGRDDDGSYFVERWEFERREGELSARTPTTIRRIGLPTAYRAPELFSVGEWGRFGERRAPPPVRRERVYATDIVPTGFFGADPEGRFFLLGGSDKIVRQVSLEEATLGEEVVLADANSVWPLGDPAFRERSWWSRVQHRTLGRVWMLGCASGRVDGVALPVVFVYFLDRDNDGVFEEIRIREEADDSPPHFRGRQVVDRF